MSEQSAQIPFTPKDLSRRDWFSAAKRTVQAVSDIDMSLRCAGVAFFTFLSVFPALAAAVSVFGLFADPSTISLDSDAVNNALPDEMVLVLEEQLKAYSTRDTTFGIGLIVSVVLALWSGSRGMNALVHAINVAQREEDKRGFVKKAALSMAFTIGAFLTIAAIIISVAVIPTIVNFWPFPESGETLALWLRWPVVAFVLTVAVFILYRKAPHRRDARTSWVMPGAIVSIVLWLAGSVFLSIYIENFGNYDATFGSIAAAAIFVLWLYFTAVVLVLGASLNANLEWQTRKDTTISPERPMGERGAYVADTHYKTVKS